MPKFFPTQDDFRKWLEKHHSKESELLVGFYKKASGMPSMTWSESVDQALCFGWIDSIRKSIDEKRYSIRFTPRKPTSIWSAVNIRKVGILKKKGLMHESGLIAFGLRKKDKSRIYSFESEIKELPIDFLRRFQQHAGAWSFFLAQPASYRKVAMHWILSAKQESTQMARLEKVILASGKGIRLWKY